MCCESAPIGGRVTSLIPFEELFEVFRFAMPHCEGYLCEGSDAFDEHLRCMCHTAFWT